MTGLVLGKFAPLHAGHVHLLDTARAHVGEENLTVMVDGHSRAPLPGELRRAWVKELYPKAGVVLLTEDLPQYPHEHPRFWELWRSGVRRHVPRGPDVLFAGEDYGAKLAAVLGARFVLVDRTRGSPPVSGTQVRAAPLRHWEHLPPCVRAHYVRRVVVHGPESTGKTVLAEKLARHFGTVCVPEFARGYIDAKGVPASGPLCTYEDIAEIAKGQLASEEQLARAADRVLICDTDLITTRIFSEEFFGRCPEWVARTSHERRYDLYLLTSADVAFVADAQRDAARWKRNDFNAQFRRRLEEKGARFVEVAGGWDERFQTARQAVEALLNE